MYFELTGSFIIWGHCIWKVVFRFDHHWLLKYQKICAHTAVPVGAHFAGHFRQSDTIVVSTVSYMKRASLAFSTTILSPKFVSTCVCSQKSIHTDGALVHQGGLQVVFSSYICSGDVCVSVQVIDFLNIVSNTSDDDYWGRAFCQQHTCQYDKWKHSLIIENSWFITSILFHKADTADHHQNCQLDF